MECLQHRNINIQNSINEQLSLHQDASPLEQIHIIFNWYMNGSIAKHLMAVYLKGIY